MARRTPDRAAPDGSAAQPTDLAQAVALQSIAPQDNAQQGNAPQAVAPRAGSPAHPPARRTSGSLAARTAGDALPSRGDLPLAPGLLRDACWDQLPQRVTDRMEEFAGETIEWWSALQPGIAAPPPASAVLVGTAGAVFADPVIGEDGDIVVLLDRFALDPDQVRVAHVVSRPKVARLRAPSGERAIAVPDRPTPGLTERQQEVLANLPPRARELLSAPFDAHSPVVRCAFHYEGSRNYLQLFGMVLVGHRHLTLATGTRTVPVRHTERTAHWALRVVRADVNGRHQE